MVPLDLPNRHVTLEWKLKVLKHSSLLHSGASQAALIAKNAKNAKLWRICASLWLDQNW